MTPSGSRVVQLRHKTVFNSNFNSKCMLCGIFGVRSSSGTTTTPHGFDILLLGVPRGHMALARAVLEGTLTECGPINHSCVTGVNLRIPMINFIHVHATFAKGTEIEIPILLELGTIVRLQVRLGHTGVLQVECKISYNLRCSRKR